METTPAILRPFGGDVLSPTDEVDNVPGRPVCGTSTGRSAMTMVDGNGLIVLDRSSCLRLASSQQLGRLSVTRHALPIVLPIAFGMVDDAPVCQVGRGAVRDAAANGAVCCFEVDAAEPSWAWAWSVMVIGPLGLISDPVMIRRAGELDLPTWPTDGDVRFIRIEPEIISGRWHSGSTGQAPPFGGTTSPATTDRTSR